MTLLIDANPVAIGRSPAARRRSSRRGCHRRRSSVGDRPEIVEHAEANDLVIVAVDTDFPMLIAPRRATGPSIVLLRGVNELPPDQHAALVIANVPALPRTSGVAPT